MKIQTQKLRRQFSKQRKLAPQLKLQSSVPCQLWARLLLFSVFRLLISHALAEFECEYLQTKGLNSRIERQMVHDTPSYKWPEIRFQTKKPMG